MKIGIVTFWESSDNYGQQLQCYALQALLRSWGHDAFLIRYSPIIELKRTLLERILFYFKHPMKALQYRLPIDTNDKKNAREEKKLKEINDKNNIKREFEQFRDKYLRMTPQIYHSYKELQDNPPEADLYITGSDQVWHYPYNSEAILGFFLQFGGNEKKRLSYAASIGRSLQKKELLLFRKYLSSFDAISVREESACELCSNQGFKTQVCVDPTMLLTSDFYSKMAKRPQGCERYAFLYVLNIKKPEDFCWNKIQEYIRSKGLSEKHVSGSGYCQARELIEDSNNILATIPEWIGLIENAQFVFTTSFHGTVFSILMHRPFLTIGLTGQHRRSNTRMEQLLGRLGIPERMLDFDKPIKEQMERPIDWVDVDRRISRLKMSSIDFLKENLD